jgi:hypothetical protein
MDMKYRLKHLERLCRIPRHLSYYLAWGDTNLTTFDPVVNQIKIVDEDGVERTFDGYFEAEPVVAVLKDDQDTALFVITVDELGDMVLWEFERVE